jgi:hypothetical protein
MPTVPERLLLVALDDDGRPDRRNPRGFCPARGVRPEGGAGA